MCILQYWLKYIFIYSPHFSPIIRHFVNKVIAVHYGIAAKHKCSIAMEFGQNFCNFHVEGEFAMPENVF